MASIGVVARQTGLGIPVLRKWEQRYGFPQPLRLESGQRDYSEKDLQLLHDVSRRIAAGERIGEVLAKLTRGVPSRCEAKAESAFANRPSQVLGDMLAALAGYHVPELIALLEKARERRTMLAFVEEIAAPLAQFVGEEWAHGALPIHGEHLFSSVLENFLVRDAHLSPGIPDSPRVLLTAPAGERHTLGLTMVQAGLGEAGIASLRLPGDLPVTEIVAAAKAHGVNAVGLSASLWYPPRLLRATILELRDSLPRATILWLGGAGMNRVAKLPPGTTAFASLSQLLETCRSLPVSRKHAGHRMKALT